MTDLQQSAFQRSARHRVAIVIVTYNSGDVLGGCLASLLPSDGVDITAVVVVDNNSKDDSVAVALAAAERLPVRSVQTGRNAGYAAAINAGLAALGEQMYDALWVMNPDVRMRPDTLATLADVLKESGRGMSVPLMLNSDGSLQPSLRRMPTVGRALAEAVIGGDRAGRIGKLGELITDPDEYERPGEFAWATGAALLVSAEVVRELGPWDESFVLYSEETEYMLRARDRGWKLWFEPRAVVEHIGGESHVNPTLAALLTVNKVKLFRRRRGRAAGSAYYAAVLLGESVRAVTGRRIARASVAALMHPSNPPRLAD
ncbi:glycosyltransferase family 2 protein [Dactylosporangium sp. NPDC051484]|uniref:glycosyltransferase family 2 protein n=1 Tax=Dactylosporangium sp. NPDC051484 TaxID=3154942 RepID=UPI003450FE90